MVTVSIMKLKMILLRQMMKFEEVQKITESFDNKMFYDYGYCINYEIKDDIVEVDDEI